jgi:hypothetical protein
VDIFLLSARNGAPWRSSSHSGRTAGAIPCVSRSAYIRCAECHDERTGMRDVRDTTAQILDENSIADVLKRVELAVRGTLGLIS